VDDLVTHIDRLAVAFQRQLHDLNGAIDTGAETAGLREQDGEFWLGHGSVCPANGSNGVTGLVLDLSLS